MSTGFVDPRDCPDDTLGEKIELRQCADPVCKYAWRQHVDGPFHCPRCVPSQPTPLAYRREDSEDCLGPGWVWVPYLGPRGKWCPAQRYALIERGDWEAFCVELERVPGIALRPGERLLPQLTAIMRAAREEREGAAVPQLRLLRGARG